MKSLGHVRLLCQPLGYFYPYRLLWSRLDTSALFVHQDPKSDLPFFGSQDSASSVPTSLSFCNTCLLKHKFKLFQHHQERSLLDIVFNWSIHSFVNALDRRIPR